MAEATAAAPAAHADAGGKKPGFRISIDLIAVLLNTLALLAAGGLLVYSKMIFKRPPITEDSERERLVTMHEKNAAALVPGMVVFDQITVNIVPSPARPGGVDGSGLQLRGRLHYATMAFSLEIRDGSREAEIDELRPRIMDSILSIMGRKNFNELSSAEGRYLLRTQIVESVNRLVARYEEPGDEGDTKKTSPTVKKERAAKPAPASGDEQPTGDSAAKDESGAPNGSNENGDFGDSYSVREGLVTNAFFTQFVVQ